MRRQSPLATYLGILLAAAGFVLIALAWNGAASLDYVQGQFPYLLSGGLTGLGLITIGVTMLVIQIVRADAAQRAFELEQLTASINELHALLAPADEFDPQVVGEYRPRPRTAEHAPGAEVRAGAGQASWEHAS